ncbi:MAG TPA: transcriptional regulator [Candidatus Limnocylindrales bacterium]
MPDQLDDSRDHQGGRGSRGGPDSRDSRGGPDGLDDLFLTATRLRIVAFLSGCAEAEFRAVQDYCEMTPSALSKSVAVLESAGYVAVRKGHVGKTPRTWLSLTASGGRALTTHLAALQWIADTAKSHG